MTTTKEFFDCPESEDEYFNEDSSFSYPTSQEASCTQIYYTIHDHSKHTYTHTCKYMHYNTG